jgi:hypothetical protein
MIHVNADFDLSNFEERYNVVSMPVAEPRVWSFFRMSAFFFMNLFKNTNIGASA